MPTYQYKCHHCGHEFEEFQGIMEDAITKCPRCGQKPNRLITGGAGFLLKGTGFYSTDYRSESYKKAAKADAPATPNSKSSDPPPKPPTPEKTAT